ncbi:hypothetical protein XENORESO_013501 [Xenotaenia resolanae]|uniref:Uncharacterized protein n=1 Tax=Xenotaenia resolanae TaxID=208358 RepID=A0ABV0X0B5_9TELE
MKVLQSNSCSMWFHQLLMDDCLGCEAVVLRNWRSFCQQIAANLQRITTGSKCKFQQDILFLMKQEKHGEDVLKAARNAFYCDFWLITHITIHLLQQLHPDMKTANIRTSFRVQYVQEQDDFRRPSDHQRVREPHLTSECDPEELSIQKTFFF